MSPSPSKTKGDRCERAVLAYLAPHCPTLRRGKAGAEKDLGDLMNFRDRAGDEWCIQVADRDWRTFGEVEAKAAETSVQAARAGAPNWVMIVKRRGTSDVGRWFAYLPMWALYLPFPPPPDDPMYACLAQVPVRAWLSLVAPTPHDVAGAGTGDGGENQP